jgi:hypothetical protein
MIAASFRVSRAFLLHERGQVSPSLAGAAAPSTPSSAPADQINATGFAANIRRRGRRRSGGGAFKSVREGPRC